ncbi:MAG: hypothetical protein LBQ49_03120 [Rickettsiales bacterium]|jgi:hypothetical protein|nr:hypothetical protein [Rickettsiales bacterium]
MNTTVQKHKIKIVRKAASVANAAKAPKKSMPKITAVCGDIRATVLDVYRKGTYVDKTRHRPPWELKVRGQNLYTGPIMVFLGKREIYTINGARAFSEQLVDIEAQPYLLFERCSKIEYNDAVKEFRRRAHKALKRATPKFGLMSIDKKIEGDGNKFAACTFVNGLSPVYYDLYRTTKIISEKHLAEYLLKLVQLGLVHTDAKLFDATMHEVVVDPKTKEPICVADYVAPLWPRAAAAKKKLEISM